MNSIKFASFLSGKLIANATLILALELVTLVPFGVFYDIPWTERFPELFAVLFLPLLALLAWVLVVSIILILRPEASATQTS